MEDNIENKILHNVLMPVINFDPKHIRNIGEELQTDYCDDVWRSVGETILRIARLMEFIDVVFIDGWDDEYSRLTSAMIKEFQKEN